MKFKKIYLVLASIPYFISVNAHQTECFERNVSDLSRPCVERLKPRALNAIDRSMIEPSSIRVSDALLGNLNQPLVAVLGATGRTGKHVLTELSIRGVRIRALSRNIEKAQSSINENYNWMRADVTEPDTLMNALEGVDILISVIGAEERAERRRGVADLERHQGFLFHGQAQAAVFLGNRQTEQTHLFHFPGDVLGNGVVLGHGLLRRNQAVADETVDGIDELVKDFLIANHGLFSVVG